MTFFKSWCILFLSLRLKEQQGEKIMRYLTLSDVFTVTCNNCGSSDVDLHGDYCEVCGVELNGCCNNCGSSFNYHDFERVEEN